MAMQNINFEIKPIFDQSADKAIWSDFACIEMMAESIKYGYIANDTVKKDKQDMFRYDWGHYKYNFAFGAFCGGSLAGFANGYLCGDNDIYLRSLYVLPKYNGFGIGTHLLKHAEHCASVVAQNIDIRSLPGAVSFYEKNGYTNYDGRSMSKNLVKPATGVIPVFEWRKFKYAKLTFDVDKQLLKQNQHQPKFIYVGPDGKIEAVGLKTFDKENVIWLNLVKPKPMQDFYNQVMLNALSKVK